MDAATQELQAIETTQIPHRFAYAQHSDLTPYSLQEPQVGTFNPFNNNTFLEQTQLLRDESFLAQLAHGDITAAMKGSTSLAIAMGGARPVGKLAVVEEHFAAQCQLLAADPNFRESLTCELHARKGHDSRILQCLGVCPAGRRNNQRQVDEYCLQYREYCSRNSLECRMSENASYDRREAVRTRVCVQVRETL